MGTFILVAIIVMWTFMLWAGWSLFFLIDPGAVVLAENGQATNFLEVFYFTGYTLITLGNGEYRPEGPFWQLATLAAATTGFFVITLSITFLLSVLPAVVEKRQLSTYLASLGMAPQQILIENWDGTGCQSLTRHLGEVNNTLSGVAQQHLAYPVLHYFHSTDCRTALPLRVVALDEALSYLCYGLDSCRETANDTRPLRRTVRWFLDTLENVFINAHDQAPPPSSLEKLRGHAFTLKTRRDYESGIEKNAERRQLLLGYLRNDGWAWQDIYQEMDHS